MEAATLADLLPQSVAVSPTTVVAGNVLTVSYTVRNQGGTNAPASHTRVQLKSAGGDIGGSDVLDRGNHRQ